jgi:hypothetical protein
VISPVVLVKAGTGYTAQPPSVTPTSTPSTSIQAQKKRRMLCIVVSRLSALFERVMLLDYQIGLNFASGVGSWNVDKMVSASDFA